jgi:hexosaminidase
MMMMLTANTQEINIIPKPVSIKTSKEKFIINPFTKIIEAGSGLHKSALFISDYIKNVYGIQLPIVKNNGIWDNAIVLNYDRLDNSIAGAYNLEITKTKIYIGSDNEAGLFYGAQTLIQLLPLEYKKSLAVPQVKIFDAPRFAYRGLHLDCGRHFFDVAFIKKYIDFIAMYKLNTFHWHLTEDQGWRIEIKKYPRLTEVGAWRDGTIIGRYPGKGNDSTKHGGYYTQAQIKEIVQYAADRYITVIPEIEMPGHSMAALAAYPELGCTGGPYAVQQTWGVFDDVYCAGNEKTFSFLQDVLDEVMELFPSKYIHIGGDECPKTRWKTCPKCQQRIKDNNLKDEHALQSYVIQRIEKYVNSKGRQIMGWDEILEGGLAPNASVMSWRGEEGGIDAAKQHHTVVMTPGAWCYFDHSQTKNEDSVTIGGYLPIEKVYGYEPIPASLSADEANFVLGAQANVWTEYMSNPNKVEYMIFPRLAAMSEVLWSSKQNRDWNDFEKRLMNEFNKYDFLKLNYSKAYFDMKASILPTANNDGLSYTLETKYKNGTITANNQLYKEPIIIQQSTNIVAQLKDNANHKVLSSITQNFSFNKATGKKISLVTEPSKNYPGNTGAFGLVNGVSAGAKGISSAEWLGWNGKDLEATIDLGKPDKISTVKVGVLKQEGSWIYLPASAEILLSNDGKEWNAVAKALPDNGVWKDEHKIEINFTAQSVQFIKVIVHNYGKIPDGKAGAGNNAWLFVDEIEVN